MDDVTDVDGCFRELFEHFSHPEAWRCDPEAAATIETLRRRGYALGMASNYDQRLRSVAAGLPPLRPLQHLVISSEVGWRKPAAQFFQAVRQAFDSASPGDVVLLAPACASFDQFENYEQRGRIFKELVHALTPVTTGERA